MVRYGFATGEEVTTMTTYDDQNDDDQNDGYQNDGYQNDGYQNELCF